MAEEQNQGELDNIQSRASWNILKKLVKEQMDNTTLPEEVKGVFKENDPTKLTELTMHPNKVIRALANSKIFYDGEELGMGSQSGSVVTMDAEEDVQQDPEAACQEAGAPESQ